ncbi:DUF4321 domain-containing protein [Cohnella yongneupensis]|uniref:DUF4321 domain-containing protein n=1 Tax=Cohnella yongneupensis TaxID=425006 RepID=A0ABW0QXN0_9BACL
MKKNGWILLLFVWLGMLAGTLVSRWLQDAEGVKFLTRSLQVHWSPSADLAVFSYDLNFHANVSLLSIIGAALAIWLYRKM